MTKYPEPGKKYRHYKGGLYEALFLSRHTETGETLVCYRSLLFGTYFSRLLDSWNEPAEGGCIRFKEIEE